MSEDAGEVETEGSIFDTKNKVLFTIFGLFLGVFIYMRVKAIIDSLKTDKWPPEIDQCPNMWVKKGDKCVNVLGIGNKRCNRSFKLSNPAVKDPRSKCRWAKYTCNVDWDGYDKLC